MVAVAWAVARVALPGVAGLEAAIAAAAARIILFP